MPFRCKCGRTYEKPDSFSTHTSACAQFHSRRMSDTSATSSVVRQPPLLLNTTPLSLTGLLSSGGSSQTSSPTGDEASAGGSDLSTSMPTNFFMPTALSLQNAFEGARRRSMSYGSSFK
ncbi:uncharacterized protein BYT42DRAFT_571258 [Radiomyces spectabilis]|uniref:uncharacterized protein n=1 Tax=Radiomyces spectabilis TaxID=64574 RepID=UPI002220B860|nr:uncharacterized protein BYT42DRAFT_571258 [Radiomyces spectabilis]KAI8377695.1 hypothetical protein BYT42DRAFT_571258 [Radiomyces spectabilis]